MGSKAREKRDPKHRVEVLHRRQLFGGRMTAMEVHQKYAWKDAKCGGCGRTPVIMIRVLVTKDDLLRHGDPSTLAALMVSNPDGTNSIPTFPTKYGPMVVASKTFACEQCKLTAETAAARGPSWALVEIDRGPGPDGATSQVPEVLRAPGAIVHPKSRAN